MKKAKLIGSLLKQYRKKNKYSREDILAITSKQKTKLSLSTIKRIENNDTNSNSYNIDAYAHIFKFHYTDNEFLYNKLDGYINTSLNLIKKGVKISVLECLLDEIKIFCKQNNNLIYLNEISKLVLETLNIYLYNEFNYENIEIFDDVFDELENNVKILASYCLMRCNCKFVKGTTTDNLMKLSKYLSTNFSDFFHFERISKYATNNNYLDFYNESLSRFISIKDNNLVHLFSTLSDIAFCEMNLGNYLNAKKHLLEAISLENVDEYVPDNILTQTNKRLGIVSYYLKDYKSCFDYLSTTRLKNKQLPGLNYCLLFKSAEEIDNNNEIVKIIDDDYEEINLSTLKHIFKYYKLKYSNASYNELEKLIYNELKKSTLLSGVYVSLFSNELKNIVEKTKHYQLFYNYINNR